MTPDMFRKIADATARIDTLWGMRCPSRVAFDGAAALATPHQILGFSKQRIGVLFVGPFTGRVTLGNEFGILIDQGITLTGTAGVILLLAREVGSVVQQPWFAVYSAGSSPCAWIEINTPDPE